MFSDADGDKLTYSVSWFTANIVALPVIDGDALVIHGVTPGVAQIGMRAVDPIGLAATGSITVTVHESAVSRLPPLISPHYYVDRLTALIRNEGVRGTYDVFVSGDVPFPRASFEFVNEAFYYPTTSDTDSYRDVVPGTTIRLYAFFGSGDPPRFPADYIFRVPSDVPGFFARYRQSSWLPYEYNFSNLVPLVPEFKAPQVPGVYPPVTGTGGPDWSLLPMPLVGDRFYFRSRVALSRTTFTVVSVDRGQVLEVPINNPTSWVIVWDLTVDRDEPPATYRVPVYKRSGTITWLVRQGASKQVPISVLPQNKLPRDFSTIISYFESEVVLIEAAVGSNVVKSGLIIKLGNDFFEVTNANRRYYRGTPLFWEVLLKPKP